MNTHWRQAIYAALTLIGIFATWYWNLRYMSETGGFDILEFMAAANVNAAAASLSADLSVAFVAFLVWLPFESRRVGLRHWWIYVVLSFTVAFACAFPAFLFMRERKLAAATD